MKNLTDYINEKNRHAKFFCRDPYPAPESLNKDQILDLELSILIGLSPENLHCDGECNPSEARKKEAFANGVLKDLAKLAKKQGFALAGDIDINRLMVPKKTLSPSGGAFAPFGGPVR